VLGVDGKWHADPEVCIIPKNSSFAHDQHILVTVMGTV
jgi:hypothetical protein